MTSNDENEMKEVENCVSEMNLRRRLGGDGNYNFITQLSSLWYHVQYLKYQVLENLHEDIKKLGLRMSKPFPGKLKKIFASAKW